jgi:hypothetical protein
MLERGAGAWRTGTAFDVCCPKHLDGARRLCVAVVLILAFVPEVLLQRGAHAPDMVVIQVPRGGAHIQTDRVALLAVQLVIVSQVLSAMLMMGPFARVLTPTGDHQLMDGVSSALETRPQALCFS